MSLIVKTKPKSASTSTNDTNETLHPSTKKIKTSDSPEPIPINNLNPDQIETNAYKGPPIQPCRSVNNYEKLNLIDEGSYGIVYRAKDKQTGEIVALKKLKLNVEQNGFPITSLREIYTLLWTKHPHIVNVKEIVTSSNHQGIFIVMEFVEHELKSLMESLPNPFLQSEIKTLMIQLLSAVSCLHSNWIVHRDLKTSNILMNNKGQIKVADFGLARKFGSPLGDMTQLVVTLWYRAPELLLGEKEYTTSIDMWSIGCIFAELLNKEPFLPGTGEIDQLNKCWDHRMKPIGQDLKHFHMQKHSNSQSKRIIKLQFINRQPRLRNRFPYITENGLDLLSKLLAYDPKQRISAQDALKHSYFTESPPPQDPSLFPTFPSKGAGEKRKQFTPSAPHAKEMDDVDLRAALNVNAFQTTGGFRIHY